MFLRFCYLFTLLLLPCFAHAQVVFTEVMYDLETGSDAGREWVEVQNTGSSPVDISGYRFREGGSNHTLLVSQGSAVLVSLGVAVIADNPAKFLTDFPQFLGTLFDSSFSLSNTGETLILKDSALVDVDQFIYTSDMGGAGDGKSLQKSATGWLAALPTPGLVQSAAPSAGSGSGSPAVSSSTTATITSESSVSSSSVSAISSGSSSRWPVAPQIMANAGENKHATVGTPVIFEGEAVGVEGKPLLNPRYLWNFGDGALAEGKRVAHTYYHPGKYVVVLDVSSGEFASSDRLSVESRPAELVVRGGGDNFGSFVEIENKRGEEVDLSYWQMVAEREVFVLPKGTVLLPSAKLFFAEKVTGFSYTDSFALHYPNGSLAFTLSPNTPSPRPLATKSSSLPEQDKISPTPPSSNLRTSAAVSLSMLATGEGASSSKAGLVTSSDRAVSAGVNNVWFYALAGLIGIGVIGVLWSGRRHKDDIEIIEAD